jgi:hypothetical protein
MKTLLTLLLILPAFANADDWTTADTQRELVFAALMVADVAQTHDIARHPNMEEANPILGKHPSNAKINVYFAASMVSQYLIAQALPEDYRHAWQYAGIGFEFAIVQNNYKLGIRADF